MDGSVLQLLDPRVLGKAYEQTSVSDALPFVENFWTGAIATSDADTYKSMYDPADVRPAPANVIGGKARTLAVGAALERTFSAFYTFDEMAAPSDVILALREPESYTLQEKGRTELTRLLKKFRRRHQRFKDVVLRNLLVNGIVYIGATGEILTSSSGAVMTIDAGVPSGNKTNLGGIVDAQWSTAGTDVFKQLDAIRRQAARSFVPVPTDIWINAVNVYHLRNNTGSGLQTYFSRNAELNNAIVRRNGAGTQYETTLTDINGFTWHFVNAAYQDSSGSPVDAIPATGNGSAILTPPVGDWMARANGRTLVPNSIDIAPSVESGLRNMDYAVGGFFMARFDPTTMSLNFYEGDKFFAGFNEPSAIWQGAVFS